LDHPSKMKQVILAELTPEEEEKVLSAFFQSQKEIRDERSAAVLDARPALDRVVSTFAHRTGQSHKLRGLLYSLWNGKPWSLSDLLSLDWSLKKDILLVALAFGDDQFFYREIQDPIKSAGQWDFFLGEDA